MNKKIFWSTRHIRTHNQTCELENLYGVDVEFKDCGLTFSHAAEMLFIAEDCDIIIPVLDPELFSELVRLNSKSEVPKMILRSNGKYMPTDNISASNGKPVLEYKHFYFEKVSKYVYRTKIVTGKKIKGINCILWVSKNQITNEQKEDLEKICGSWLEIVNYPEEIVDLENLIAKADDFDALAVVLPLEMLEKLRKQTDKPILISKSVRRADKNDFSHCNWIEIKKINIVTKKLTN